MAYVNVPNDLSKIKTKLAFGLTKRQIICFGGGAGLGIPLYLFTRNAIGNTAALLLMLVIILRDADDRITGVVYMTEAEVTQLLEDMSDADN